MVSVDVLNKELKKAEEFHSHLCAGVTMGVRMALYALELLDWDDEYLDENLMVITESPRCFSDGILSVVPSRPGKKSFMVYDHGKISASFFSKITGEGVRITDIDVRAQTDDSNTPELADRLKNTPIHELFSVQFIKVNMANLNLKGADYDRVFCSVCGELVKDNKHVNGVCFGCAPGPYYDLNLF